MPFKKESTSKEDKPKKAISSEISIDNSVKTIKSVAVKKSAVRKPAVKKEVSAESEIIKLAATETAVKKTVAKKPAAINPAAEKTVAKKQTVVKEIDQIELKCIADAILDKKGSFVCSLNLSNIGTAICDYFVICNADSRPQVMAIADNIEEMMIKKCKRKVLRMQGKENAFWIILDYANIVVHVFQTEYRQFYRIEDLWADAEKTIYQE